MALRTATIPVNAPTLGTAVYMVRDYAKKSGLSIVTIDATPASEDRPDAAVAMAATGDSRPNKTYQVEVTYPGPKTKDL